MPGRKVIAIFEAKNEEKVISLCLRSLSELVDEIIMKDDGSTDRTVEIARQFPKVTEIWQKAGGPREEVSDMNGLTQRALRHGADWIILVGADEIFEPRMKQRLPELLDQAEREGIGQFRFRKSWLWGGTTQYRVDKPEKFFSYMPYRLFKASAHLRWTHPTPSLVVRLAKAALGIQKLRPQFGFGTVEGIPGSVVEVPDIVMVHYAAVDLNDMIKKHILYAVTEARFHPHRPTAEIVHWAFALLNTATLQLAPVPASWFWPWQTAELAALHPGGMPPTPANAVD
jgi:glycosyltransferase involved in cell wall biosynthesis